MALKIQGGIVYILQPHPDFPLYIFISVCEHLLLAFINLNAKLMNANV